MSTRCLWPGSSELMLAYHDQEWGVPVHEDNKWFEFIILDGFQAGLSWAIILKKRTGFRQAFAGFDFEKVARFDEKNVETLMQDTNIVRNRLKIEAMIYNARKIIEIRQKFGSLDAFLWQFTGGKTIQNAWENEKEIPTTTPEAEAMSRALVKHGFKFVGPTICYSFMQAGGMVNDHIVSCFRYQALQ